MPYQARLGGPHIRRRHHQCGVCPSGSSKPGLRHGLLRRLHAAASNHRHATLGDSHGRLDERDKLIFRQRCGFSGRSGNDKSTRTCPDLVFDQACKRFEIKRIVNRAKRSSERANASGKIQGLVGDTQTGNADFSPEAWSGHGNSLGIQRYRFTIPRHRDCNGGFVTDLTPALPLRAIRANSILREQSARLR